MIAWGVETLIASTLLMILVLVARTPVRRAFGPGMAYALWALPALRMLLPPLPESWREGAAAPIAQASETLVYYVVEPIGGITPADLAAATPTGPVLWPALLIAAWTIGAVGFIGYHLIRHGRFCARVRRLARSVRTVAGGNVEVIETDAATGPLAFGIWRKYVAFPCDFAERYDPLERDLALAHELGHHARGDLLANWAALVVLALHWFNPVAWRAFRAFRADQEMACDALVLSGRAAGLRHAYGRAIVKSAHGGAVSAACHLHTINELKGRLRMLTVHEGKSRQRLLAGGAAVLALTMAGLGVTASGTQAAERMRSGIERSTGVDLASLAMPVAQAAPAAPAVAPDPAQPAAAAPEARKVKRVIVIRDKDGKVVTRTIEGDDIADLDDMTGPDGARMHRFVFRSKDGKPMPPMPPIPPAALARLKNMPDISSRNCGTGEGDVNETVIHGRDGEKRRMIICTNRIERMASAADEQARAASVYTFNADAMARHGRVSALEGLRQARDSVRTAEGMSDAQRASALDGIEQAIREIESNRDE